MAMDVSRASRMIIEINAGVLETETSLITDEESREAWRSIAGSVGIYKADGIIVEVPFDLDDPDEDFPFLDDDFSDRITARLDAKNQISDSVSDADEIP
jgi:hypothetical protein